MIGSDPRQTGPGALDPDNLAKPRPEAPFDLTGTWAFRGEDDYRANYGPTNLNRTLSSPPRAKTTYEEYLAHAREGGASGNPRRSVTRQACPA